MKRMSVFLAFLLAVIAGQSHADNRNNRKSGYDFMSPSTQAMQNDDSQNPAMLWIKEGAEMWNQASRTNDKSCASCHGEAAKSMHGVAARYPAMHQQTPITLSQRINLCRQNNQGLAALTQESQALLGVEGYVALQSRGMPITPPSDPQLAPFIDRGKALFSQRLGQLNMSCAHCHDEQAGKKLGSSPIPQAHPTAYPMYRLEWQGMGSLQRRVRNCMTGVRAKILPYGALQMVELELYLNQRAKGMMIETPGVRP
jgi:L-cysteine S-thiosulfotransferase